MRSGVATRGIGAMMVACVKLQLPRFTIRMKLYGILTWLDDAQLVAVVLWLELVGQPRDSLVHVKAQPRRYLGR